MNTALADKPIQSFGIYSDAPDNVPPVIRGLWWGGESFIVDKISGKLATEFTPKETRQEYVIPEPRSILYWINRNDLTQSRPGIGISDSQYKNWEAVFQDWIKRNGLGNIPSTPSKPSGFDDVHTAETVPMITVNSPTENQMVDIEQPVVITATAQPYPGRAIRKYEFLLNGQLIGSKESEIIDYQFIPADYISIPGLVELEIIAIDSVYSRSSQKIPINIVQ